MIIYKDKYRIVVDECSTRGTFHLYVVKREIEDSKVKTFSLTKLNIWKEIATYGSYLTYAEVSNESLEDLITTLQEIEQVLNG